MNEIIGAEGGEIIQNQRYTYFQSYRYFRHRSKHNRAGNTGRNDQRGGEASKDLFNGDFLRGTIEPHRWYRIKGSRRRGRIRMLWTLEMILRKGNTARLARRQISEHVRNELLNPGTRSGNPYRKCGVKQNGKFLDRALQTGFQIPFIFSFFYFRYLFFSDNVDQFMVNRQFIDEQKTLAISGFLLFPIQCNEGLKYKVLVFIVRIPFLKRIYSTKVTDYERHWYRSGKQDTF